MDNLRIRREEPGDYRAVEELTRDAFWNQYVPGCSEHYLAHVLRGHPDFLPELDLVAERDGRVVGNIMYTKARLEDAEGNRKEILTFGPLSVAPGYQRQGIGKRLMEVSFRTARELGYDTVVIFGHPGNYISSGFKHCSRYGISLEGVYPTAMLVRTLTENALDGRAWNYRESSAYEIDDQAAEEFDRGFAPREKGCQASQEEFFIYSHSTVNI